MLTFREGGGNNDCEQAWGALEFWLLIIQLVLSLSKYSSYNWWLCTSLNVCSSFLKSLIRKYKLIKINLHPSDGQNTKNAMKCEDLGIAGKFIVNHLQKQFHNCCNDTK